MKYDDDELLVELPNASAEEKPPIFEAGKTQMTCNNRKDVPLEKTELKVLVELTGLGKIEERYPLDLVTVLDVSGSMNDDDKIGNLKIAMQFLIRKLSPLDRISVVTFNNESKRLFPLRQITEKAQDEIIKEINDLKAYDATNTAAGLKEGLKVLKDRGVYEDRVGAIILMSDGEQNMGDAREVDHIDEFPMHTFGFGEGYDPELLKDLAVKSNGGTFADVRGQKDLSKAFSLCLGGLLTVVVKDLKLTITPFKEESEIKNVCAGNYQQTKNVDGSETISFGELYNKEVRKVLVNLLLPKVDPPIEKSPSVLRVTYMHSAGEGKPPYEAPPVTVTVNRKIKARGEETPKVILELNRLNAAKVVTEAMVKAQGKKMGEATEKLTEAKRSLEGVKVADPNQLIKTLIAELKQILEFMTSFKAYKITEPPYVSSFTTSHDRQRPAARGDLSKPLPFLTPRMSEYLKQAKKFEKDPSKPPPSEAHDREKDQIARIHEEEEELKKRIQEEELKKRIEEEVKKHIEQELKKCIEEEEEELKKHIDEEVKKRIEEELEKRIEEAKGNANPTNGANPGAPRNFMKIAIQALKRIVKRITHCRACMCVIQCDGHAMVT